MGEITWKNVTIDGSIVLKKMDIKMWTVVIWLRIGSRFEHNRSSGSMKDREFLHQM